MKDLAVLASTKSVKDLLRLGAGRPHTLSALCTPTTLYASGPTTQHCPDFRYNDRS